MDSGRKSRRPKEIKHIGARAGGSGTVNKGVTATARVWYELLGGEEQPEGKTEDQTLKAISVI